eukprot:RCo041482
MPAPPRENPSGGHTANRARLRSSSAGAAARTSLPLSSVSARQPLLSSTRVHSMAASRQPPQQQLLRGQTRHPPSSGSAFSTLGVSSRAQPPTAAVTGLRGAPPPPPARGARAPRSQTVSAAVYGAGTTARGRCLSGGLGVGDGLCSPHEAFKSPRQSTPRSSGYGSGTVSVTHLGRTSTGGSSVRSSSAGLPTPSPMGSAATPTARPTATTS